MDKFFDRLGDVLKSFLNDDSDDDILGARQSRRYSGDPDLDAAYDELEEFLNTGKNQQKHSYSWSETEQRAGRQAYTDTSRQPKAAHTVPEVLRKDFEELGVPFGASEDECKAAYKRLLKIHHPDRHAGHPGNMKKATEKSARINVSYQRIQAWRETGKVE
ncbi:DnaJ family molecular chaperone [Gracilinema caldarium]|uniref:J domain-containing protein n=1 Tax=Gracilinema caldarium TaxID=215591 RepID=UPI0026F1883B|nr:J domain-containing protein [Gracilinema caldarium]